MRCAVAVPLGKVKRSLTMNLLRSGLAKKTPKKASAVLQRISEVPRRLMGSAPWSFSGLSWSKAGTMPIRPAVRGMEPSATAVACRTTFSCGVKLPVPNHLQKYRSAAVGREVESGSGAALLVRGRSLTRPKPTNAACMELMEIQEDWRPK